MPNEIYHRSDWGESKAEGFGDVYYDHAATNKLYNHSDYYENSDGTDATLKDLNNKASIVLTPTAYSDGSLNTVIPPYQVLSELVTNGDFSDGSTGWTSQSDVTFGDGTVSMDSTSLNAYINQDILTVGSKYRVSITVDALSIANKLELINGSGLVYKVLEVGTNNFDIIVTGNGAFRIRTKDGATSTISSASVKEIQEADFDFSRGSSATRVNEQGLVEDVQILSGELVQNGNFEQIGSELVTNGDFNDGLNGWSSHSGSILELEDGRAKVTTVGSQGFIKRTDLSIQSGKIYFCTAQITNATIPQFYINGTSNVLNPMPLISGNTYGGYITTTGTNSTFYIRGNNVDGQVSFIDNVSVKEVGQNWSFGTGWSINDGKVYFDNPTGTEFYQSLATTAGKYRISFDLDITSGTIQTSFSSPSVSTVEAFTTSGTKTVDITTTASFARFRFVGIANSVFNIDNVSVKEVTDDTDLPRIDFTDGTGSLLLEPQRTNVIPYSQDFSNSAWTKERATISANTSTSPDGSVNASKIIENTQGGVHSIYEGVAISNNIYTFSCFVKKSERDYCFLQIVTNLGRYTAVFDLVNGIVTDTQTVSSPTNTSNKIEDYGNGWYRVSVTSSNTTSTTGYFQVGLSDSANPSYSSFKQPTYIGDGSGSIQIWGAMAEVGDYETSYIPTSGSTVTRSADVANNSGNADLFNDSEGVLYADFYAEANNTEKWITLSDGTSTNRVIVYIPAANTLRIYVQNSSGAQADFASSITLSQYNKVAFSYKENDFKLFLNGTKVGSDTSGGVPSGLDRLNLADRNGTTNPFIGNVKCIAVFKEALSNDLLERLTGEGYESFRLLAEANNYTII